MIDRYINNKITKAIFFFLIATGLTACGAKNNTTIKNNLPHAKYIEKTISQNSSITISLVGTDIDTDPLVYSIVNTPVNGTLTKVIKSEVTYTANSNFTGSDYFTYRVYDGKGYSNIARVMLTIAPVNHPPVAISLEKSTTQNTPITIVLEGTDADNDSLVYEIVSDPLKGRLGALSNKSIMYTPFTDVTGSDSFTYKVYDGKGYSNIARVMLTIAPVNHPPVATPLEKSTTQNTPITIVLEGTDADNDSLVYEIVSNPLKGRLGILSNKSIMYTPFTDVTGSDGFTYKVYDGKGYSNIARVMLTITSVNHLPVAIPLVKSTTQNTPIAIVLEGTDADNDSLDYQIVSKPLKGQLGVLSGKSITYTPNTDITGSDSFTYKVYDGKGYSNTAKVMLTITPVNHLPVATPLAKSTTQNTPIAIVLEGTDADNDSLVYEIVSNPLKGQLGTLSNKSIMYTPFADVTGSDSFTYKVYDGKGYSNTAIVSISIINNKPPIVDAVISISTSMNTALALLPKGTDPDGDTLTYNIKSNPTNGKVESIKDRLIYTPNVGFIGKDSFSFAAFDGYNYSKIGIVNVNVIDTNINISLDLAVKQSRTQLTGDMRDIVVVNTYAFVAAGEAGLHVVANIDTEKPKRINTIGIEGEALSVTLASDKKTVFIAGEDAGLVIVDISVPAKAKIVSQIKTHYSARKVALSSDEKLAYIADGLAGLTIIDISNHLNPQFIANVAFPYSGDANDVKLTADEKYAFVASSLAGLTVFDVSNPKSPVWLKQLKTQGIAYSLAISHERNLIFIADGLYGVLVIDISNPEFPIQRGRWIDTPPSNVFYPINAIGLKLLSDNTTLLVVTVSPGIYRVETMNNNNPETIDYKDTPSFATAIDLSVDSNLLFVLDAMDSLLVYSINGED